MALFSRAPIDEFAKSLAQDIARRYPVAIDGDPAKRPSVNRLTRIVEDACAKVQAFQAEHRLGSPFVRSDGLLCVWKILWQNYYRL